MKISVPRKPDLPLKLQPNVDYDSDSDYDDPEMPDLMLRLDCDSESDCDNDNHNIPNKWRPSDDYKSYDSGKENYPKSP